MVGEGFYMPNSQGSRQTIVVGLEASRLNLLRVLGEPEEVLAQLLDHVLQGVERPGAWEREWLCQAFGHDWLERVAPDPDCQWRDRPATW